MAEEEKFGEDKRKHLEFIQNIITRMGLNSFWIKGWTVTLSSALLGLAIIRDLPTSFIYLIFVPIIVFWGLDGFFLMQERAYVKLYNGVKEKSVKKIDFGLDASDYTGFSNWLNAVFSRTLIPFYIGLGLLFIILILVKNSCYV